MKATKYIFALALVGLISSCEEDSQQPIRTATSTIQFEINALTDSEKSTGKTIGLKLTTAAPANGYVVIDVQAPNMSTVTIQPSTIDGKLTLPVTAGSSSASFTLTPIDNTLLDGPRTVTLTITKVSAGLTIGTSKVMTITITDDEQAVQAEFLTTSSTLRENETPATKLTVALSAPAPGSGQLLVSLQSEDATYAEHYTTEPAAVDGIVTIPVAAGADRVELRIIPINNDRVNGTKHVAAIITAATGAITLGTKTGHGVTIQDDELDGVSKSYATGSSQWGTRRYFAYDDHGRISKVTWEQYTPAYIGGTYRYIYQGDQLEKMVSSDGSETLYTYANGRIVKADKYKNGILKQTSMYGYDPAGNVGEVAEFYRQPSGEMKLGMLFVYLYYLDGNVYKQLVYDPNGDEDPTLISSRTYSDYLDQPNHFPAIEILPNQPAQSKLPGSYRLEENGNDIQFTFTYEFDADGRMRKRTASSSSNREVTVYSFY